VPTSLCYYGAFSDTDSFMRKLSAVDIGRRRSLFEVKQRLAYN